MILSESQIRSILHEAGFKGLDLEYAIDICFCESGFDTNAHNFTNREDSRGLMQINIKANPQYSNLDLFNPQINATVAFEMYSSYGFQPWTCSMLVDNPKNIYLAGALVFGIGLLVYYLK